MVDVFEANLASETVLRFPGDNLAGLARAGSAVHDVVYDFRADEVVIAA